MASTFAQKTRELGQMIGDGKLVGKVEVDQIYALAIESGFWRSGPLAGVTNKPRHGGETHALANSLERGRESFFRNLAHHALEPGGLEEAMIANVEALANDYREHAPRETGALANSAHPSVESDGRKVYDRPPLVPRLSKEQLAHRHEFVPRRHFGR